MADNVNMEIVRATGVWGGRTSAERTAERRAKLIEAATDIWTEDGWAAVSMRGVCSRTSLNDRYFYEHFADRDELLAAVWDGLRDSLIGRLLAVVGEDSKRHPIETLRQAISVVVESISTEKGWAQIMFTQHVGCAILEERRTTLLHQATALFVGAAKPYLAEGADETGLRMDALIGIGGFTELVTAWQSGLVDVDATQIIDHSSRVGATLARAYFTPED